MTIKRLGQPYRTSTGWDFDDPNNDSCPVVGSYQTKAEANKARISLQRSYASLKKLWQKLFQESNDE